MIAIELNDREVKTLLNAILNYRNVRQEEKSLITIGDPACFQKNDILESDIRGTDALITKLSLSHATGK